MIAENPEGYAGLKAKYMSDMMGVNLLFNPETREILLDRGDGDILCLTQAEEYDALLAGIRQIAQDWQSVTIDDQIYINFMPAQREGLESITIKYTDQDKTTKTIVYNASELEVADGHYNIPVVIAPAQIGDTIIATLAVEGASDDTLSTSVADYCNHLIANYDGVDAAAVKALAVATLEYGQAAKEYFNYEPEAPAFATTEAAQDAISDVAALDNHMSVNANGNIKSISFMALTKPEFRFYVNPYSGLSEADYVALNDKITVDGNASARFVKNPDTGAILLEVTGIETANMDEVITIEIDGFGTITFCGNDFARLLAKNNSTATLGAALYLYGVAAKACFA